MCQSKIIAKIFFPVSNSDSATSYSKEIKKSDQKSEYSLQF